MRPLPRPSLPFLQVSCLEIGAIPAGRQRARFLAVGSWDNTIRILSLDPDDCMTVLAVLAVPSQPSSAALVSMPLGRSSGAEALILCIGRDRGSKHAPDPRHECACACAFAVEETILLLRPAPFAPHLTPHTPGRAPRTPYPTHHSYRIIW